MFVTEKLKIKGGSFMDEYNEKYKIIVKIENADSEFGFVIGYNKNAIEHYKYATWLKNSRGYDSGHYFNDLVEAKKDLVERYTNFENIDLRSEWYHEYVINDISSAMDKLCDYNQEKKNIFLNNHSFISKAIHEYNKLDLGVDESIIDMLENLMNAEEFVSLGVKKVKFNSVDVEREINSICQIITEKYNLESEWYGDCYPDEIEELKNYAKRATTQEEYEYYLKEIEKWFDYQAQNLDIVEEIEM